jgi:hypothetical protein
VIPSYASILNKHLKDEENRQTTSDEILNTHVQPRAKMMFINK